MKGTVEVFWKDGRTGERTKILHEQNTIVKGASETIAEYLTRDPNPYLVSGAGLAQASPPHNPHLVASAIFLAVSNCGIHAISFGKDQVAY